MLPHVDIRLHRRHCSDSAPRALVAFLLAASLTCALPAWSAAPPAPASSPTATTASTRSPASASASASASARLDLRVPRITEMYSAEQIQQLLARIPDDIEEVEVEGSRGPIPQSTPDVWRGAFAPVWAVLNPTQAWRIFMPLPPDQTRAADEPFDATSGHLEPAALPPELRR